MCKDDDVKQKHEPTADYQPPSVKNTEIFRTSEPLILKTDAEIQQEKKKVTPGKEDEDYG